MKDFLYKKLIVILILFQPIIDIITSFMVKVDFDLSLGILSKVFLMILAGIYLVFIDKKNRKFNYTYLFFLLVFFVLNLYNNVDIIEVRLIEFFSYFIKYIYHLVMLLFLIRWYQNYEIKLYSLRIPLIIIIVSFIISIITNTAFLSYETTIIKKGISGWYNSANELGNLLCLLFPVCLYNAFHNKDGIFIDKILLVLSGIIMLLLGTKVGLLGYFCVLLLYLLLRLVLIKKKKLDGTFVFVLILFIVPLLFLKYIPAYHNMTLNMEKYGNMEDALLSGRDVYLKEMIQKRENCNYFDIFIGKSFIRDETGSVLIIEQDFYDIYFMYGIIGIILFISLYIKVYIMFFKKIILYIKRPDQFSKKYFAVIVAISLELCVAFISGHSLLSPSVSTFLILLVAMSLNINIYKNSNKKEKILISNKYNYINFDSSKYDVVYLSFRKKINHEKENILYPYYQDYNILHKGLLEKVFYSKIILFNLVRNQIYDVVFYENDDNVINYFLKKSNGIKKIAFKENDNLVNLLK